MKLIKRLAVSFLALYFLLVFGRSVILAKESFTPIPAPTPIVEINSFELFWPVVAGKTMGDPFYSLKNLKENIRGMMIFGIPQRTEYALSLATKRVVEAEKLIKEGKNELADKTLEKASKQLEIATLNIDKAIARKIPIQGKTSEISNKLSNLEKFLPWLIAKTDKNSEALRNALEKVSLLKKKI